MTAAYASMRNNRDQLLKEHHREEIIFIVDQAGKIDEFTERALECTGKPRAELIGQNVMDFVDTKYREDFKQELRNAWVGLSRDFPVAMIQCTESGDTYEAKLMRLTSTSRRALLVVFR